MSRTKEFLKRISILLCIVMTITVLPTVPVRAAGKVITDVEATGFVVPAYGNSTSLSLSVTNCDLSFPDTNLYMNSTWQKKGSGDTWSDYSSSTFTEGTYRYRTGIDNAFRINYDSIPEEGFKSVTVDGVAWVTEGKREYHAIGNYQYQIVHSPEYTITPPPVTVSFSFDGQGGSHAAAGSTVPANQTITKGEIPSKPDDPIPATGYTFVGWQTRTGGTSIINPYRYTTYNFDTPLTSNTTLYAYFRSMNTCKVTFYRNHYNNDYNTTGSSNVYEGECVDRPANPTWSNHVFDDWYTTRSGGTPFDFSTPITQNTTLYAHWLDPVTVSFSLDGKNGNKAASGVTAPVNQTVGKGKTASIPESPDAVDGWAFTGWYKRSGSSGNYTFTEYDFSTPVTAAITLYAGWEDNEFEVAFVNGTKAPATYSGMPDAQTVEKGECASEPGTTPSAENWEFLGWYADAACTSEFDFNTAITKNTTVYAGWKQTAFKVVFEKNCPDGWPVEGMPTPFTLAEGDTITKPADPYRPGPGPTISPSSTPQEDPYVFVFWSEKDEAGTLQEYDFSKPVTHDVTLYAKWKTGVWVTFANGTTVPASVDEMPEKIKVLSGSTITAPDTTPSATGWTFDGWYQDAACTQVFDFANTSITGNTTIYAKWLENYTVTFTNSNPSVTPTNMPAAQTVADTKCATQPSVTPSASGWTFAGWYADASCTTPFPFNTGISGDTTVYSKWTQNSYTVTFDVQGKGTNDTATVLYGETVTEPSDPTYAGFTFDGWYTNSGCTDKFDFDTPITGTTHLYAKWLQNYTVTFNNSNTSVVPTGMPTPVIVVDGSTITPVPSDPTADGWTFAGWYTNSSYTGDKFDFTKPVTTGVDLYAKWAQVTCTVNFNGNTDGLTDPTTTAQNVPTSTTVPYGSKLTEPAEPTAEGYTFSGWYTDKNCTYAFNFSETEVKQQYTLYAKWIKNYTVTFDKGNVGTTPTGMPSSTSVPNGSKVTKPTSTPTAKGWTFDNWYSDEGLTTEFDFATVTLAADTTIYAKWTKNSYTVTFNLQGKGSNFSNDVLYNETVNEPTSPVAFLFYFDGWYTDSSCTAGKKFDFDTPIVENIELFAKWLPIHEVKYYDTTDHGSATVTNMPTSQQVIEPTCFDEPEDPSVDGYEFVGWFLDLEDATPYDFDTPSSGNIKLYAKWTQKTYQFKYDSGILDPSKVTNMPTTTVVPHGSTVSEPSAPTADGYEFGGWYTDSACGAGKEFVFTTTITADTTVYAKWLKKYEVEFVNTNSSVTPTNFPTTALVAETGRLLRPSPVPSAEGWTFDNWYVDEKCTTTVAFPLTISGKTTLYGAWTRNYYDVEFDLDGHGIAIPSQSVEYGAKATMPTDPSDSNWTFDGWYADEDFTTPFDFDTLITEKTTVYAKWLEHFTVTFDKGDLEGVPTGMPSSQTVADTKCAAEPTSTPTAVGYVFVGWFAKTTDTTAFNFDTPISANTTLYAKWEEKADVTLTFKNATTNAPTEVNDMPTPTSVVYNDKASSPSPTPWAVGYSFDGWTVVDGGQDKFDFANTAITTNTDVYAKWNLQGDLSFTFKNSSTEAPADSDVVGMPAATVPVKYNATITPPANPSAKGWEFVGWYKSGATEAYDFDTKTTQTITLYAKWKKMDPVTLTYANSSSGSHPNTADITNMPNPTTVSVAYNDKASTPSPAPIAVGYEFMGWVTTNNGTTEFPFESPMTTSATVYAKWESRLPLAVMFQNGTATNPTPSGIDNMPGMQSVKYNSVVIKPETNPSAVGYKFEGYYSDKTCTNVFDFDTLITNNTKVYIKWSVQKSSDVTFNLGTTGPTDIAEVTNMPTTASVEYGATATEPSPTPSAVGY